MHIVSAMAEPDLFSDAYANELDSRDRLSTLRDEFLIPSRHQLSSSILGDHHSPKVNNSTTDDSNACTYLCGNSLGLQPRRTEKYFQTYLATWATKGVHGHFAPPSDSPLPAWLHADEHLVPGMASLLGAEHSEIAIMQTLTANLHFALASIYRPTSARYKIMLEGKAFPSDHYAVESQLWSHGVDPTDAMILIESRNDFGTLSTQQILETIDAHAETTAVLLLPAIQYYSGQFFDMHTITQHAQSKGILVGWDLAHAIGNVPLQLHDWNVDFAVWCSYKYLNCGPGSIGGLFVHSRHTNITDVHDEKYRHRLAGWWGSSKTSRFGMSNVFEPMSGAAGYQLSNPSIADMTALQASLDVFKQTSMAELREKSLQLTGYLLKLLDAMSKKSSDTQRAVPEDTFVVITPRDEDQRGAQLSVRLKPGLLDNVMKILQCNAVVVDERRPDVVRVAPAPLYNSFGDVLSFARVFRYALLMTLDGRMADNEDALALVMGEDARNDRGWGQIL